MLELVLSDVFCEQNGDHGQQLTTRFGFHLWAWPKGACPFLSLVIKKQLKTF
jgi:hypothetical protein